MKSLLLLVLVGCAGPDPASGPGSPSAGTTTDPTTSSSTTTTTTPSPQPTSTWACRDDVPAADLNGSYPPTELLPPEFSVLNYDGSARTKADLQGHITVMWFYPAASTAG